jgi:hypothetical protein
MFPTLVLTALACRSQLIYQRTHACVRLSPKRLPHCCCMALLHSQSSFECRHRLLRHRLAARIWTEACISRAKVSSSTRQALCARARRGTARLDTLRVLRQLHLALLSVHVIVLVLVIVEAAAAALTVVLQLQPKLVSHSVPGPSSTEQLLLVSCFMIVWLVPRQRHPGQIYIPSKPGKCILSAFDVHALAYRKLKRHSYEASRIW